MASLKWQIQATRKNLEKLGTAIPISAIGEPDGAVPLSAPVWVEANGEFPAYLQRGGVNGAPSGALFCWRPFLLDFRGP